MDAGVGEEVRAATPELQYPPQWPTPEPEPTQPEAIVEHQQELSRRHRAVAFWHAGAAVGAAAGGRSVAARREKYMAECPYGMGLCVWWGMHEYGIKAPPHKLRSFIDQ